MGATTVRVRVCLCACVWGCVMCACVVFTARRPLN